MTKKIGRTKITSADCVLPEMMGKYDLVFYTSQRARAIISGAPTLIEGFEKPEAQSIIVALEEIRQGELTYEKLMEGLSSPFVDTNRDLQYSEKIYKKEDFVENTLDEEEDEDNVDYSEGDFED